MNKILELRDKRAKAWDAAKAFLDARRGDSGLLLPEDVTAYEKMEADVVALGKEIERLERQAAVDAELAKPTSQPITGKPTTGAAEKTGRASGEYKNAFWNVLRNKTPHYDVMNALQIGTDSEGGYLVPDEYERRLIDGLQEQNILRSLATTINTSSGDRKIPVVASHGSASWIDEEGTYPESDDAFSQVTIGAYKVGTMIKVSEELLNDSVFDIESYIASEFTRRIGAKEEDAFINGNGSGKPTGLLHATYGGQVGVTAASSTAITADEIIDLYFSLKAPYRSKAVWLINDTTAKTLRKLKDGNGDYLWQRDIKEDSPNTILGRPVYYSAYMPTITAGAKTVLFGNLSYYWIADRQSRSFKRLGELYAPNGQVGFMGSQRVDGKLLLPESVKLLQMKA